ncbi:MAG TPA: hypothetical protein VF598_00475, partial [Hymenobacter sp.]
KMSKSYDNTIPLFSTRDQLKKLISGILTDSREPGEAKDVQASALFDMYQAFASEDETATMRLAYAEGISWGDAKIKLFDRIDQDIAPMRERYQNLISNPAEIEDILQAGALKARRIATPLMLELRNAVGLRRLAHSKPSAMTRPKARKSAMPSFKQYRENDGQFYVKLLDADGRLLVQSAGYPAHQEAAAAIKALQQSALTGLAEWPAGLALTDGVRDSEVRDALNQLASQ